MGPFDTTRNGEEKFVYDEKSNDVELLQKYRRDRRELLNYLLSASIIKKVVMPPGAFAMEDVDLDQVSVDHVLECARKGTALDLADAIRRHHEDANIPLSAGGQYFLFTDPEMSGEPPSRPPPLAIPTVTTPGSLSRGAGNRPSLYSTPTQMTDDLEIDDFEDDEDDGEEAESRRKLNDARDLVIGLPEFETGITEDDLRETAYEALLVCIGAAGGPIAPPKVSPSEEKEKKRMSSFRRRFSRSKKDKDQPLAVAPPRPSGMAGLMELMRAQMEIGEGADLRTREALVYAAANRTGRMMDSMLVPVELLCNVSRDKFSDKRAYIRWQKRMLNMVEEGLVNHPHVPIDRNSKVAAELITVINQVEEAENLPAPGGLAQHAEALRALRTVALGLAERAGRGDNVGDVCHWADGYHLNVRLYEKLLNSVFDVLDEKALVEDVDEVLKLVQSTWKILGITQTIHDACYAWVIFRQFVLTDDDALLGMAVDQLRRIVSESNRSVHERTYMRGMRTKAGTGASQMSYIESVLTPMKGWCDRRLSDYHQNLPEGGHGRMELLLSTSLMCSRLIADESDQTQVARLTAERLAQAQQTEEYIKSSIKAAYSRVHDTCAKRADIQGLHPLALLANDVKGIAKVEASTFHPILSKSNPDAIAIAVTMLHSYYQSELKPFLDGVSQLTEDVATVLPAADGLEAYLMDLLQQHAGGAEGGSTEYMKKIVPYDVEVVSGTLIMRWINVQLAKLSEWVERTLHAESWEPMSQNFRHATSAVEVFRIIEETLDQLFGMNLPMRMNLLKPMLSGIDNALQLYAMRVVAACGPVEDLVPPVPALTRFKKDQATKVANAAKKRDPRLPDERRTADINALSIQSLAVRLNTFHYIMGQLDSIEDHVKEQWAKRNGGGGGIAGDARPSPGRGARAGSFRGSPAEEIAASFEPSRKAINMSIDKLCTFLGVKIIFWDLREPFIEGLYRLGVAQARMDRVIVELDPILAQMCHIIAAPLRDRLVLGLLQASLDGLVRVLLDGGAMRVFAPTDADMLDEDLVALKDFFVADGDGLPRGVVENTSTPVAKILALFALDTNMVVENFKNASGNMASGPLDNSSSGSALMRGAGTRSATDAETLLRVLCHRQDREASKYLKKSYKLPKA